MPTIIRKAETQDLAGVLAMSKRFYATTNYGRIAPMDDVSALSLITTLATTGILVLAERNGEPVGFVGMLVVPFVFNVAVSIASEIAWWVEPVARGAMTAIRLMGAMESECRARGCKGIQMMRLANSPKVAERVYARLGYTPSEYCFTKEL